MTEDVVKQLGQLALGTRLKRLGERLQSQTQALLEEAYQEAQKHQPAKASKLEYSNGTEPIILTGDRAALKHALSEVMLNALQANPSDPKISVRAHADAGGNGAHDVQIEIQDNGTGFASTAGQKIPTPFFTTRNVGLGHGSHIGPDHRAGARRLADRQL